MTEPTFKFPLGLLSSSSSYEDIEDTTTLSKRLTAEIKRGKVHNLSTAAELQTFLSTTTYAIVTFWTNNDGTHKEMGLKFAGLSNEHAETGLLAFARADTDDMRDVALRCCK